MSGKKSVQFRSCPCGKRGFLSEHDADKALGRAQAKKARVRGMRIESRYYPCEVSDLFHLTAESRRTYERLVA